MPCTSGQEAHQPFNINPISLDRLRPPPVVIPCLSFYQRITTGRLCMDCDQTQITMTYETRCVERSFRDREKPLIPGEWLHGA